MTLNPNTSTVSALNELHGQLREQGFEADFIICSQQNYSYLIEQVGPKCQYENIDFDGVVFRCMQVTCASGQYYAYGDYDLKGNEVVAYGTPNKPSSILKALKDDKQLVEKV